jgi:GTPase Era involved in 16S rRNA processing
MLEIPIKNIKNEDLLENAYFMDIPGLNENNATYIEDIFSVITLNEILFEIMIFDSTSIGSDNILKIFEKLNQKNSLKKEDNLYILNKIDKTTGGGYQEVIDYFKQYFYQEFEDEKNDQSKIAINISKNHFIPLNSILYQAETKCDEDFYSMILLELFAYLETANKEEISSFFDYLVKRLENIIKLNEMEESEIDEIDDDSKDMEIIKESIEKINNIQSDITTTKEFSITINLERKKQKKVIKNLYVLHKQKKFINMNNSESFDKLQNIINNYKLDDLACPPSIEPEYILEQKKEDIKKEFILSEMNTFLNNQLKGQFGELNSHLNVLSENLLGRKIRISFIGNISVGKSSVLNTIIGENILPTSDKECTYRGVIIKHRNLDDYYLYGTRLEILEDGGINEYYTFKENKDYYCKGIEEIKSRLKCKNNDKNMDDKDAFIVIQGRLKIFDFIKLDEELISKIEFIDLPGHDRKNNTFNQKQFYTQILQFSNSCIYINEPKTIDDEDSVIRIQNQYSEDKQKLHPSLRDKFINSCLFLINKADTLSSKKEQRKRDEEKIIKSLLEILSNVEKNIDKDSINNFLILLAHNLKT